MIDGAARGASEVEQVGIALRRRPRPRLARDDARQRRCRHPPPRQAQPAFAPYSAGEISPGPEIETPEQILAWVAKDAETALHPSCTAKMGTDPLSVVDPTTMGVHGLEGLRVADASAMPYVTNGNIYAPVMMLAEKAADLILGNQPLPAEHVEFYRHRPATQGTPASQS